MKKSKFPVNLLALFVLLYVPACNLVKSSDSPDNTVLLGALYVASCPAPSTFSVSRTDTLSNGPSCTTNISSDVPAWIQTSFHCVTVYTCGTYIVFKTNDLPPFKTGYYTGQYNATDFTTGGHSPNPNTIKSQSVTLKIPSTPTYSANPTSSGYGAIGVTTWGIVIYNNQAAPGDSLSTEYTTMDDENGHPTS